tara:strand:+ start:3312 stop:3461 length:150 start_codon:yes stop_codon:yes gene_type:complete
MYIVKVKDTGKVVAYCSDWKDASSYFACQKIDKVDYIIEEVVGKKNESK